METIFRNAEQQDSQFNNPEKKVNPIDQELEALLAKQKAKIKVVEDVNDKVEFSLKNLIGQKIPFEYKEGKLTVKIEFPDPIKKELGEKLKERIKEIKDIDFKK